MGKMGDAYYWNEARRLFEKPRKEMSEPAAEVVDHGYVPPAEGPPKPMVQFSHPPQLSRGTNPGAWVMMWAWIPDPPEEKEDGEGTKTQTDQGSGSPPAPGGGNG